MVRRMGVALVACLATYVSTAMAYTPTVTPQGVPVKWKSGGKLNLVGNPRNQSGLSEQVVFDAVVRSLQRWKAGSGGGVGFDYWQGTDPQTYRAASAYDGYANIYFASQTGGSGVSPNVLGLTQVWYNVDSGEILETDTVLNDIHYRLTTRASDTSGYGSAANTGNSVFIENVLTHELGHSYGLSHSGHLQSTMLFMESPEQAFLACDEQAAMRAIYGADGGSRGAITGRVISESGSAVFGAQVSAISRRRGAVLAASVTDSSGRYRLGGLEPGQYFLMVEPFYAGASALPPYYGGMQTRVCGGQQFSRGLHENPDGTLIGIDVGAGGSAGVQDLVAKCEGGGAAVAFATAAMPTTQVSGSGFGMVGRFGYTNRMEYHLVGLSGRVEIHALSYSLYSPVDPVVQLFDKNGRELHGQVTDDVYAGTSGYVNRDASLIINSVAAGDYTLRVSYRPVSTSQFPAGPVSIDTVPFLVITGSVNEGAPPLADALPFNARCRMEENFETYASPPGGPRRSGEDEDDGTGFCGTVSRQTGGPGPSLPAILGWFLPWVGMLTLGFRKIRRYT